MNKQQFDKKAAEFKKIFGFPVPFDRTILLGTKKWTIDMVKFDGQLEKIVPEYDADECTYKGVEGWSLSDVVTEVYGERAKDLIDEILNFC